MIESYSDNTNSKENCCCGELGSYGTCECIQAKASNDSLTHELDPLSHRMCQELTFNDMTIAPSSSDSTLPKAIGCDHQNLVVKDMCIPQICVIQELDKEEEKLESSSTPSKWQPFTKLELLEISLPEVKEAVEKLRDKIEETSSALVSLLQERQRLRDEVTFRNVTIEQLLKVHEQLTWGLTEPLTIQMGVIFPDEKNECLDCK